jgi:hypothetical protein
MELLAAATTRPATLMGITAMPPLILVIVLPSIVPQLIAQDTDTDTDTVMGIDMATEETSWP